MKKSILLATTLLALASCKKDDDKTASGTTPAAGFTWTEDGGAVKTADSAYWTSNSRYSGIRAYQGGAASFFEINWDSSAAVGTHALNKGLTLVKNASTFITSTSGTVTITANSADKLTGTLTSSTTGGVSAVSCTFTDLPKR